MSGIVIVCDGDCGRTTADIPKGLQLGDIEAGEFEQIDESGVPLWTCYECVIKKPRDTGLSR